MKKKNYSKIGKFKVGEDVYIPSAFYLSHGEDDFSGGLCKIIEIEEVLPGHKYIRVKEQPSSQYPYDYLLENQKKWKKEYGKRRGKACPDYSPNSNCWAAPGDIVNGVKINHYIY